MKKILATLLAAAMTLSLVACGGGSGGNSGESSVDATKAVESFNSINADLKAITMEANDNLEALDEATVAALTDLTEVFKDYKAELDSADLTQERADAIIEELAAYPDQIAAMKAEIEGQLGAGADDGEGTELPGLMQHLVPAQLPENLAGTGWEFSGGYIDGKNMEQEEAEAALAQYGGTLQVVFVDDSTVAMVQGSGQLAGTYAPAGDGYTAAITFDNNGSELKYAGIFSDVGGTAVLVLFSDATFMNAIYFTQIEEG